MGDKVWVVGYNECAKSCKDVPYGRKAICSEGKNYFKNYCDITQMLKILIRQMNLDKTSGKHLILEVTLSGHNYMKSSLNKNKMLHICNKSE